MFICPDCHKPLVRAKNEKTFFWYCRDCGGRAMTLAALRQQVDKQFLNQLWQAAKNGEGLASRPCPVCAKNMIEIASREKRLPELDVCTRCNLIWFDPQEFAHSPKCPPPKKPEEEPLSPKAREALAIYKVQQIQKQYEAEQDSEPDETWQYLPAFMGLPVETEVEPLKNKPWATWLTVGIVSLISILGFTMSQNDLHEFCLIPSQPWRMGGLTFLTSFFFHGGVMHLVGNMYFLLIFGDNVEDFLGWKKYLLLLFAATLAGGVVHSAIEPRADIPCLGASGGISGIILFYALKFPRARLSVMVGNFWLRFYTFIRVPALAYFGFWVVMQFFIAYQQVHGFSSVSALAHLGGASAGLIAWIEGRKLL